MMKEIISSFSPMSRGVPSWESSLWRFGQKGEYTSYLLHSVVSLAPYIQWVRPGSQKETAALPLMKLQQENGRHGNIYGRKPKHYA